jgi:hypothetical protein
MAEDQNREDLLKSQLANLLTTGKMPNELAESNFFGAKANALNTPEFLNDYLAGQRGQQQSLAATGKFDTEVLPNKIAFTNREYGNKILNFDVQDPILRQVARELEQVPEQPGIGFNMQPKPTKVTEPKATPSALFATMQQLESNGRRYGKDGKLLTSPKGAQGENQVMPATQRAPGYGVTPARDDSPDEIARVGKDYLAAMYQRYGNEELALAAYNGGPAMLDKVLKQAQATGQDWRTLLPDETRNYIAKSGYSNQQMPLFANMAKPTDETPFTNLMNTGNRSARMAGILAAADPKNIAAMAGKEEANQGKIANLEGKYQAATDRNETAIKIAQIAGAHKETIEAGKLIAKAQAALDRSYTKEGEQEIIEAVFNRTGKQPTKTEVQRYLESNRKAIQAEMDGLIATRDYYRKLISPDYKPPEIAKAETPQAGSTIKYDSKGNRI